MSSTTDATPDTLVLAAIERAALHRANGTPEVPVFAVLEHLGIPRRGRRIRVQFDAMVESGLLERSRYRGFSMLALTKAGRRRLQRARREGSLPTLPESPQHARWRVARTAAEQEIGRLRRSARDGLARAAELVDDDPGNLSDDLFEAAERLSTEYRRLAAATYCLREWAEPNDALPDVDGLTLAEPDTLTVREQARLRSKRAGRRTPRTWEA